jgi:hypothetical protein
MGVARSIDEDQQLVAQFQQKSCKSWQQNCFGPKTVSGGIGR